MPTRFIVSAILSAFAASATAAPFEAPYALSAVHADFQAQLDVAAAAPGAVGAAARTAADLLRPHNAVQENRVLPFLGFTDAATGGCLPTDPQMAGRLRTLDDDLSQLLDGETDVVTALVGLYVAADDAGQTGVSRLAEQMIWHEVSDMNVLYPAASLVATAFRGQGNDVGSQVVCPDPASIR